MNLLQNIYKLLDFKPTVNQQLVFTEFNAKYGDTFVKINNENQRVSRIEGLILYCQERTFDLLGDHRISPIVLETGLYKTKKALYYCFRIPKRQWAKSFKLDANTSVLQLAGEPAKHIEEIIEAEFHPETYIFEDKLYLHYRNIGKVKDNKITLLNTTFEKEIAELWPQYQIIMQSKPQRKLPEDVLNDQLLQELRLN